MFPFNVFNSPFTNSFGPNNVDHPFFDYNNFLNPFFESNPFSGFGNSDENERRQGREQRPKNNEEFKNPSVPPMGENKNKKFENPFDALKVQGNEYFKKGNYEKAIECYTKAIENDSSQAVYYMNRAIAYKYSNNLKKVELFYIEKKKRKK